MHWSSVTSVMVLASLAALAMAAPLDADTHRAKRSEEMVMYGNHQNLPKVKKADPNMSPLPAQDNAVTDEERKQAIDQVFAEDEEAEKSALDNAVAEEEEERKQAIDQVFAEDEEAEEAEKSKQAIEQMFSQDQAPIAEDMIHETVGEEEGETSGEAEEKAVSPGDAYYYNFNDYYYPEVDADSVQDWLRADSAQDTAGAASAAVVGREERSADGRDKRSAIVAEDMMGGLMSGGHDRRLKRDLTEEQIRELLDGGGYGGDEYYNYPSFNLMEPAEVAEYPEVAETPVVEDYPEDYREYLEELMDNALLEADEAEQEEQQVKLEQMKEQEAEREYEEYLEEKEEAIEEREEVQNALGLLRIMYENIPDGAIDEEEEEEMGQPIIGQREEVGPGYRVEETWKKYLPTGASISQENVLTDYRPIVYEGEEGIFIPMGEQQAGKRSTNSWGTLSTMPGMKKRGYVGFADKREGERNYGEYGRLFRLARALRGQEWQEEDY